MAELSHVDVEGRARMVDVGHKEPQRRLARATGMIELAAETRELVRANQIAKGDVLTVAQIAGIQAAKRAGELIPLCHPLVLDHVAVTLELTEQGVAATSEVSCTGRTGVEMEALTAVSVALLAVYDMCKAVDKSMRIGPIVLLEKSKSPSKDNLSNCHSERSEESGLSAGTEILRYAQDDIQAMSRIEVVSVNVSEQKGTAKRPVEQIVVDDLGIVGDAHAGPWHRQVSLLAEESVHSFSLQLGQSILPGQFGENISFRGLPAGHVAPLDRFLFDEVELEVTQIGKECHGAGCTIFQQVGKCLMPIEGLFARVVHGGTIRTGDHAEHVAKPFTCLVLTLSDRAAAGQYEDRSGPRIKELLEGFFAARRRQPAISNVLLPDDPEQLRLHILRAKERGIDLIFTTGGTGVGPRDIAPETVAPLCERFLPGIMEHIRAKYGEQNPRARLSRSIAGVAGKTQIYTLPGSVRAVEEYMAEIVGTLEHVRYMLHELDVH